MADRRSTTGQKRIVPIARPKAPTEEELLTASKEWETRLREEVARHLGAEVSTHISSALAGARMFNRSMRRAQETGLALGKDPTVIKHWLDQTARFCDQEVNMR